MRKLLLILALIALWPAQSNSKEIWSGKLVERFYDATVFGDIANTDYEGEISAYGDKVIIRTIPTMVIRDYQKGGTLIHQRPESPNVELNIDKAKYFDFIIDDIDRLQSDLGLMDLWSSDAGEQMKIAVDTTILAAAYVDAHADNKGLTAGRVSHSYNMGVTGTPLVVTTANVLDIIVDAASVADEANWPETGRWMVIPSWFRNLLMKSDLKNASLMGDDTSVLRNGRTGMIERFMLYLSNNLPVVTDGAFQATHILFGHKSGLTFASQMTNVENLRGESTFGTIVRGLNVYGFDVIKTEAIGDLYVRKG